MKTVFFYSVGDKALFLSRESFWEQKSLCQIAIIEVKKLDVA